MKWQFLPAPRGPVSVWPRVLWNKATLRKARPSMVHFHLHLTRTLVFLIVYSLTADTPARVGVPAHNVDLPNKGVVAVARVLSRVRSARVVGFAAVVEANVEAALRLLHVGNPVLATGVVHVRTRGQREAARHPAVNRAVRAPSLRQEHGTVGANQGTTALVSRLCAARLAALGGVAACQRFVVRGRVHAKPAAPAQNKVEAHRARLLCGRAAHSKGHAGGLGAAALGETLQLGPGSQAAGMV